MSVTVFVARMLVVSTGFSWLVACGASDSEGSGERPDVGRADVFGRPDAVDRPDGGNDASPPDAATDAARPDAFADAASLPDVGLPDADLVDARFADAGGSADAAVPDASTPDGGIPPQLAGPFSWARQRGPTTNNVSNGRQALLGWTGYEVATTSPRCCNFGGVNEVVSPWVDDPWFKFSNVDQNIWGSVVSTGTSLFVWGGESGGLGQASQSRGYMIDGLRREKWFVRNPLGAMDVPIGAWSGSEFIFVHRNRCDYDVFDPCMLSNVKYDPVADEWTALSTVDHPDDPHAAVWAGNRLLTWGPDPDDRRSYNVGLDAWSTFATPAFPLAGTRAVWNGTEMFVWDGAAGGLYDVTTDSWTQTSTLGAPAGDLVDVEWTGFEFIVLTNQEGAHYDPAADAWRPVADDFEGPNYSVLRDSLWTGSELIVTTGAGTHRYGPFLTGTATCTGVDDELRIESIRPTTRVAVQGDLQVKATIESDRAVLRADWMLDGVLIASGVEATIPLGGLPRSTVNLRLEAEDAGGRTACRDRTLFIDERPELDIESPENGAAVHASVDLAVDCTDDGPNPCTIVAGFEDDYRVGQGSFLESFDVTAFDGGEAEFRVWGFDERHQRTETFITVPVEASPDIAIWARAPSKDICDVATDRILYETATGDLAVFDVATSTTTQVINGANRLDCAQSFLLPNARTLSRVRSTMTEWTAGGQVDFSWTASAVEGDGRYFGSLSSVVERADLDLNRVDLLEAMPEPGRFRFAGGPAGGVVWTDLNLDLWFEAAGGTATIVAALPDSDLPYPATDGTLVVWRETAGTDVWDVRVWDGTTTTTLRAAASLPSRGPISGRDHQVVNGRVAFHDYDVSDRRQVWLWDPISGAQIVTGFVDETRLLAIDDDGDVLYERADRVWHYDASANAHADIASDRVTVWVDGGTFLLQLGTVFYEVLL